MSRAVVSWPLAVRPEAFLNVVSAMPSARALRVISVAKRASLPATASASTTALSLVERIAAARIRSRTRTFCPALKPTFEAGCAAAARETVTV